MTTGWYFFLSSLRERLKPAHLEWELVYVYIGPYVAFWGVTLSQESQRALYLLLVRVCQFNAKEQNTPPFCLSNSMVDILLRSCSSSLVTRLSCGWARLVAKLIDVMTVQMRLYTSLNTFCIQQASNLYSNRKKAFLKELEI